MKMTLTLEYENAQQLLARLDQIVEDFSLYSQDAMKRIDTPLTDCLGETYGFMSIEQTHLTGPVNPNDDMSEQCF